MPGAELNHLLRARVPEDLGGIDGWGGGLRTVHGWVGGVGGVPVQLLLRPAVAVGCHAAHCPPLAGRGGLREYCRIRNMTDIRVLKRQVVHRIQRLVVNPIGRQLPVTMLETTGRRSGQPRRTAVAEASWTTSSGWSPNTASIRTTSTTSRQTQRYGCASMASGA